MWTVTLHTPVSLPMSHPSQLNPPRTNVLEAADIDAETLARTELYNRVGVLVYRTDAVGAAATKLPALRR